MGTTRGVDPDLLDMLESLFASFRRSGSGPGDVVGFDPELWKSLAELGLSRLTGSERGGGSAAGWQEAASALTAAAAAGVPVPLAEHDLLAGWLLETAGLPTDDRLRTAGVVNGPGTSTQVPWARHAQFVVLLRSDGPISEIADIPAEDMRITEGRNIAGEPRDTVTVDPRCARWVRVPDGTAEQLLLRGALARSIQACGAMETIVQKCVSYASDRIQFGRPLGAFQAVQNLIADLAAEAALARAATDATVLRAARLGWSDENLGFAVAVAKSCTGHAASTVVRNAHQVHGAIGTTYEHDLHRYTKPVLAWRSEFGSVRAWDEVLTRAAIATGRRDAWDLVVAGRPVSSLLREALPAEFGAPSAAVKPAAPVEHP